MKKILFMALEAVPFIKTGGLADVVGLSAKNIAIKSILCEVTDSQVSASSRRAGEDGM